MSNMIQLKLPDGNIIEIESGSTILDAAGKIGSGLAKATLAGKIDGLTLRFKNTVNSVRCP